MTYEDSRARLIKLGKTELVGICKLFFAGKGNILESVDENELDNVSIEFPKPNAVLSVKRSGYFYKIGICILEDMNFNYFLEKRNVHTNKTRVYSGLYVASDLLSFNLHRFTSQLVNLKV